MPLVRGRYPLTNSLYSILGQQANSALGDTPVRTNLEYLGINGLVDTAASLVTQIMTVVPVPVDPGTIPSGLHLARLSGDAADAGFYGCSSKSALSRRW